MNMPNPLLVSRHLSISIGRSPKDIYRFASNPANLPRWATTFCKSVKKKKGKWWIETSLGTMEIQIVKKNPLGVLDHILFPQAGAAIYVPMRVVANGQGSEVIFTLFRAPNMSNKRFTDDITLVNRDLRTLKNLMERGS